MPYKTVTLLLRAVVLNLSVATHRLRTTVLAGLGRGWGEQRSPLADDFPHTLYANWPAGPFKLPV